MLACAATVGTAVSLSHSPADGATRAGAPAADGPTLRPPASAGPARSSTPTRHTQLSPRAPLVWSDEFSGPAGASPYGPTWQYALGGNGWGNQELQCYTDSPDNSVLDGHGELVLTARYDPGHACSDGARNDYTSARITTETLRSLQYGQVRVRALLPTASGVWPAIWALGVDSPQVGFPASGELDIAEVVGSTPELVYGTLHAPSTDATTPFAASASTRLDGPASSAFHVYGIDWTPDSVSFSVDGSVYSTVDRADVARKGGVWVFDHPFYLLLNVAVGGTFPGPPEDPAAYPQSMRVDYVRVYR